MKDIFSIYTLIFSSPYIEQYRCNIVVSCLLYLSQVLTHGYLISHHNVDEFIKYISLELNRFENGVAEYMKNISEVSYKAISPYLHMYP